MEHFTEINEIPLIDDVAPINVTTDDIEEETTQQKWAIKIIALAVDAFQKNKMLKLQANEPLISTSERSKAEKAFKTAWEIYVTGYCTFFQRFINESASLSQMKSGARFIFTDYSGNNSVNDFRRHLIVYFNEQINDLSDSFTLSV